MQNIEKGEYLAYKEFAKEDIFAMLLIEDFVKTNVIAKQVWNKIFYNESPIRIKRTQQSEINQFIKNIIAIQNEETINKECVFAKNRDAFNATILGNDINIIINTNETSTYSIKVVDLNSNYIQAVVPEIRVQAGEYEHKINVPSGNYVVVCYLNGNINSKKVSVK